MEHDYAETKTALDCALALAKAGIPSFHCWRNSKKPATSNGFKGATTNTEQLRGMFSGGQFLVGVPTGTASGLVVVDLDVDPEKGVDGIQGFEALRAGREWPETRTHKTPRGGIHYVFRNPRGIKFASTTSRLAPGVDTRGAGGYAIWPPSERADGVRYKVVDAAEPAEVPAWFLEEMELARLGKNEHAKRRREKALAFGAGIKAGIPFSIMGLLETGAEAGSQNDAVFRICCALRDAGWDIDKTTARVAEFGAMCRPPFGIDKVASTIRSAYSREPRGAGGEGSGEEGLGRGEMLHEDGTLKDLSWTGLAEMMNKNRDYAYNESLGWLRWTGSRWKRVQATQVRSEAVAWATREMVLAKVERDASLAAALYKARDGESAKLVTALQAEAFVEPKKFEDEKWILNVANGLLDLRTLELRPHERTYGLCQAEAAWDPDADMDEWNRFLDAIFEGQDGVKRLTQVLLGYACTGCVQEELFAIFYGGGANGKSTLLNVVAATIGDYYGDVATSVIEFQKNGRAGNTPELATLHGKRLIACNEPPDGMRLDDAAVKNLASKEAINVTPKFKETYSLPPSWLTVVKANYLPSIRAVDDGLWRRVMQIMFLRQFMGKDADKGLTDRLIAKHRPAVLRWLAEGAKEYFEHGLPHCQAVADAGKKYREEQDSVLAWLAAEVDRAPETATVLTQNLFDAYKMWCRAQETHVFNMKRFVGSLEKHGYKRVEGVRNSTFKGLQLVALKGAAL